MGGGIDGDSVDGDDFSEFNPSYEGQDFDDTPDQNIEQFDIQDGISFNTPDIGEMGNAFDLEIQDDVLQAERSIYTVDPGVDWTVRQEVRERGML